jgi:hypothetical protein
MLSSGSENSSVAHRLSCFGVDYWGLVSLHHPLSLGQGQWFVRWPPAISVMRWFGDYFKFCSVVSLWMLLTGSGDKVCGPLPALFQAVAYHLPAVSPSVFPAFVYWKFTWRSASCLSPLIQCFFSNSAPLLCVSFQFLVYCSVCFLWEGWVSLLRGLWFILGVAGSSVMLNSFTSLFIVFSVSLWCLFRCFIYLFFYFLIFFVFVVLEFLECLLYVLVDHV